MTARLRPWAVRLATVEVWIVAALAVASLAAERLLPYALAAAACFWAVRWLAAGRPTVRTPGDWAIGLLVLMAPVTLWATALPEVTRPQVLRLLMGVAFYYAAANWAISADRLHALGLGLVAAGAGLAVVAPFVGGLPAAGKLSFIPTLAARLPQVLSGAVNPNIMAGALAVLAPLALAIPGFAWPRLRWFERTLTVAGAVVITGMLVLTQSRGALLGLVVAAAVLAATRWRWGWLGLPLGALAGGLAVWRIGAQRAVAALLASQALGGADQRLEIWSRALYMIQDFPFTGVGMGTFRQVANLLYPFFLAGPDAEIPHAHNLFLQVAVDLGLPGLVAWLALLLLASFAAWRVWRQGRVAGDPRLAGLGAGLLAGQVALAVHGLTDAPTWGSRPAVVVWALWGLAVAAYMLPCKDKAGEHPAAR